MQFDLPGYAIGGLSGGEKKNDFWKIVAFCTDLLPEDKPRYCMGVGYVQLVIDSIVLFATFECHSNGVILGIVNPHV